MKSKINKHMSKSKGFTLVELLAVLSIIIILLSFIIPKVYTYEKKAEDTKMKYMANQIYETCMVSYSENNGSFNESLLSSTLKEITGLDIPDKNITVNSDKLEIVYTYDKKDFTLNIDGGNNTYALEQNDSEQPKTENK